MKKYLKIIAIVLLVVGIGVLALAADFGYRLSGAIERTDATMQALEQARAEGDADKIEDYSYYLRSAIANEAKVKQTFTMYAAGGIVSLIIGVVLWFVSRKKKNGTEKELATEAEQAP